MVRFSDRAPAVREVLFAALRVRPGLELGGKMASSRPGPTLVRRGLGAVLVVLLLVGAVLYYRASPGFPTAGSSPVARPAASPSPVPDADPLPSTATPEAGADRGSPPPELGTIQLYQDPVTTAKPFQTVQIRGTYHGRPDTFLRLQRREGTTWLAFPLPAKTDRLGRFITHVELGDPGPHWLRVVDLEADVTSEPFVLAVEG